MINLVKKDLKLSTKINVFALIYAIFIAVMGIQLSSNPAVNMLYVLAIIMLVFVSVIYSNGYDDKYKSEIVLNSFPIDRRDIVRGKYLTLIIFILTSCILIFLFTNIAKLIGFGRNGRSANILDLAVAINILLIFYSIYYPFYFKLGEGIRTFNVVMWVLVFVGPNILKKVGKALVEKEFFIKIASLDLNKISLCFLIFGVVIYYISLQVSKRIYMNREF